MARVLIDMPKQAKRGQVIEVSALIAHPMESGFRVGAYGNVTPRNILVRFECRYAGELVFAADLYPAIAANPYLAFTTVATRSGTLTFTWEGDHGFKQTESVALVVE